MMMKIMITMTMTELPTPKINTVWRRRYKHLHHVIGVVTTVSDEFIWMYYPRTKKTNRTRRATFMRFYEQGFYRTKQGQLVDIYQEPTS